jgi:hypothetical protein
MLERKINLGHMPPDQVVHEFEQRPLLTVPSMAASRSSRKASSIDRVPLIAGRTGVPRQDFFLGREMRFEERQKYSR